MIIRILMIFKRFFESLDTIYPFTDYPQVSVLRMVCGFIIIGLLASIFTGKLDNTGDDD